MAAEQADDADDPVGSDDETLLARARGGDTSALSALFIRYHDLARNLAASLTTAADPEDITSESFSRVFAAIRRGNGPTTNFRAYLLSTIRTQVIDHSAVSKREVVVSQIEDAPSRAESGDSAMVDEMRRALSRLPQTWRVVLWKAEVEGLKTRELAPVLGLTPAATSALLYRAREGLREAYLLGHLEPVTQSECEKVSELMAGYVRGSLRAPRRANVDEHVGTCPECRDRLATLATLNRSLDGPAVARTMAIIGPVALLGTAALAHLLLGPPSASLAAGQGGAALVSMIRQIATKKLAVAASASFGVAALSGGLFLAVYMESQGADRASAAQTLNGSSYSNNSPRPPGAGPADPTRAGGAQAHPTGADGLPELLPGASSAATSTGVAGFPSQPGSTPTSAHPVPTTRSTTAVGTNVDRTATGSSSPTVTSTGSSAPGGSSSTTPTSSAPTSSAPTSSAPTSSAPTSSAPTSSAPTSSAPTSSAPTSSAPTSGAPGSEAPGTPSSEPTSSYPSSDSSDGSVGDSSGEDGSNQTDYQHTDCVWVYRDGFWIKIFLS